MGVTTNPEPMIESVLTWCCDSNEGMKKTLACCQENTVEGGGKKDNTFKGEKGWRKRNEVWDLLFQDAVLYRQQWNKKK